MCNIEEALDNGATRPMQTTSQPALIKFLTGGELESGGILSLQTADYIKTWIEL